MAAKKEPARFVGRVRIPRAETLAKYGLDEDRWRLILAAQGPGCAICGNLPESGVLHIDHRHGGQRGKRWGLLPPDERRATIRGLLCFMCNRSCVARGVTVERLEKALVYLKRHEAVRPE